MKLPQRAFVHRQPQPRHIRVEINEAIFRRGFAVEDVPEQFGAALDIDGN